LSEQPARPPDADTEVVMSQLLSVLASLPAQAIPDPAPAAPAAVSAKAATVIGFIKWASLIAGLAGLAAFGMLALAADRGGMGSHAADMKERLGKIIVALVVVMTSTSIVSFIAS
jgi:hypothetical protein